METIKLQKNLTTKFITSIMTKIEKVQKRSRTRLLVDSQVENFMVEVLKSSRSLGTNNVTGYLTSGVVTNSYGFGGESTWVRIRNGELEISRDRAKNGAYGRGPTSSINNTVMTREG